MKQERRITYQAGITRTPSDFLCKDGELAECINLVTDHEELKPMVPVKLNKTLKSGYSLVYVFRYGDDVRYILWKTSASTQTEFQYRLYYWDGVTADDPETQEVEEDVYIQLSGEQFMNPKVTQMGRTLIISSQATAGDNIGGLTYFLWDGSDTNNKVFKRMGNDVPDFYVDFSLGQAGQVSYPEHYIALGENIVNGIEIPYWDHDEYDPDYYPNPAGLKWADDGGYDRGKDALIGLVASRLEKVKEDKRFAFPFMARAAVRLYDGTYTHISNPFLLLPTVRNNWNIYVSDDNGAPKKMENGWYKVNYVPFSCPLNFRFQKVNSQQNWKDWQDLVKGIDVFVTDEVMTFNTDGTWMILNSDSAEAVAGGTTLGDTCSPGYNPPETFDAFAQYKIPTWYYTREDESAATTETATIKQFDYNDHTTWRTYFRPKMLTEDEIIRKMLDDTVFYKIAEIDISDLYDSEQGHTTKFNQVLQAADYMRDGTLKNLRAQQTLETDDYFTHSRILPNVMKVYNGRLHLADYRRTVFGGFGSFSYTHYSNEDNVSRDNYVHIRTNDGNRVVKALGWSLDVADVWFYYPDSRAYQVDVFDHNTHKRLYSLPLKEHPRLNGAYYFGHLPSGPETKPTGVTVTEPATNETPEVMEDHLLVSDVLNPFTFGPKNDQTIGRGRIIGLATQATALGAEEHGLHQMIVFSERGISTLKVNDEGAYTRVDEMPREVCINANSILETDGAVFFVSKKGLMMIVGNTVTCMSGLISGRTFNTQGLVDLSEGDNPAGNWRNTISNCQGYETFMEFVTDPNCFLAYDYIDSRILICNSTVYTRTVDGVSTVYNKYLYAYVYNISDGSFSKMSLADGLTNAVIDYPDTLLQDRTHGYVYTLYGKDREDQVQSRQRAFLMTRPMKLAGPDAVSSLRELVNVGMWRRKSGDTDLYTVKTEIWLSDDLYNWYPMESRFGAAAKYFRIGLYIYMLPTERLSGTIIMEQERRTDNQRA